MSHSSENVSALRSTLLKAKSDLDFIARQLEEEFASQSSTGAPLHHLLRSVTQLESEVGELETDYNNVQTAKRELLDCSQILIENWRSLQTLRGASGLPDADSGIVEGLEGALQTVRSEVDQRTA